MSNVSPPLPHNVRDLLALCDEPFVDAVYRTILGREADPSGRVTYTAMVRDGADKAAIVALLSLSDEGRQRARTLDGLAELLAAHAPRRQSLLARIAGRLGRADAARSDETLRLLRAIENRLGRMEVRLETQASSVEELRGSLAQMRISVDALRSGTPLPSGTTEIVDTVPARQAPPDVDRVFHRLKRALARRVSAVAR